MSVLKGLFSRIPTKSTTILNPGKLQIAPKTLPILSILSRLYSSSSSSSSPSTKKSNSTPTHNKQELSLVPTLHIHPKDLAGLIFFAEHRPLLAFSNDQSQQVGHNKQAWDEEDYEDENSGSNVTSFTTSLSSLTFPAQPAESSKFIVYQFLSKIESGLKQSENKVDNVDNVEQQEQSGEETEKTLYCTNILQKRRLKMKKHKLKKLRKRTRALRLRQGKI